MIPTLVYILCLLTSIGCAALLLRAFRRTRSRLLFWSGLCFVFLSAGNVLLIADLVIFPEVYLAPARSIATLCAIAVMLYGLIFESR